MSALDDLLAAQAQSAPASAAAPASLDQLLAAQATAVDPGPEPQSAAPSRFDRFVRGVNDIPTAAAQLALHLLPSGFVGAVNSATAKMNSLPVIGPVTQALGMVPATADSLDKDIRDLEATYQSGRKAAGQSGFDGWRMAGNVAGTAPLAFAAPAAGTLPAAAGQGAAFSALSQPVTGTDYWSEKSKQAALGALLGAGTSAAVRGASSVIAPSVSPDVQKLLGEGVTPTAGQILGGAWSRAEQAATSIPVLGDMIRNAQRRAASQLNTAAINRSLAPIGESLPDGSTGRDALGYAVGKLGDAYDGVLSRIGAVKPDAQFMADLSNLGGLVQNLPKAQSDQFGRIVDSQILSRIDQHGMLTGEAIKAAESNLGNLQRGYGRSPDFDTQQMSAAIQEAQAALRSMLQRQAPAEADTLSKINLGYANLLRPQRAMSYVGAEGGTFSPAQLQSAVKALDPSKNNRGFALGTALMQDLSEPGKAVLGSTVPDSGTPFRHAVQAAGAALLGHSMLPESVAGAAIPAAAGLGAAALPYTQAGQKAVAAMLTQRPDSARALADLLMKGAPLAPLGAPALVGGMNR